MIERQKKIIDEVENCHKEMQEKNKQLEELLAEQYPDLKQSLDWANEREKELQEELTEAKEIIREYIRLSLQEDKDLDANVKLFQKAEVFINKE